jgi:hypothetical protein
MVPAGHQFAVYDMQRNDLACPSATQLLHDRVGDVMGELGVANQMTRLAAPSRGRPPQGIASRKPFILLAFRGHTLSSEMGPAVH